MKLKPYPEYKPSGVEWLGDVPSHWEAKRLKMAARLSDKKIEADEDAPLPYIGLENIESWTGRIVGLNPDIVPTGTANLFQGEHVLFGKLRPYLAKACTPDFEGLCSTELLVLGPQDFERQALLYFLLSDGFVKLVDSSTYGSKMPRANWDFIGNCIAPVAPRPEQTAIADFLDRETGKIDRLVAKKRELIAKLKEKRAALITRAVTCGLNPDLSAVASAKEGAKLKPSGIEWLGDIPEHWEVCQLRRKFNVVDCKHRTVPFVDEGVPLASIREVHSGEVDLSDAKRTTIEEYHGLIEGGRRPEVGDIIYSRNATVGDAAIVATEDRFCMGQDVCLVRTRGHHPKYILYLFHSEPLTQQVESLMIGSTFRRINVGQIKAFWICVPPFSEQQSIADYLDRETAKLDQLAAKVEEAILRLQEYRTALITAAVTGKIDVRGVATASEPLVYPEPDSELRMVAENPSGVW